MNQRQLLTAACAAVIFIHNAPQSYVHAWAKALAKTPPEETGKSRRRKAVEKIRTQPFY